MANYDPELDPNGNAANGGSDWFASLPSSTDFTGVTPGPPGSGGNSPYAPGVDPSKLPDPFTAPNEITAQYQKDFGRAPTDAELASDEYNLTKYGWDTGPQGGVQATIDARMNNTPNYGEHANGTTTLGSMMSGPSSNTGQWTGSFTAPSAADARNTPGYQFAVGEIQRLGQNAAGSRGTLLNPRTTQALNQAETNFADTNYQQTYSNAFNNYLNNQQQFNQNFSNSQTAALNNANIANMLFGQGLQSSYLNLFGQNQAFGQGQTANQNLFGNWLQSQYLYRPPYPTS